MREVLPKAAKLRALAAMLAAGDSPQQPEVLAALVEGMVELADEVERLAVQVDEMDGELDKIDADLTDIEDVVFGGKDAALPEQPLTVDAICVHCKKSVKLEYERLNTAEERCPHCQKPLFNP